MAGTAAAGNPATSANGPAAVDNDRKASAAASTDTIRYTAASRGTIRRSFPLVDSHASATAARNWLALVSPPSGLSSPPPSVAASASTATLSSTSRSDNNSAPASTPVRVIPSAIPPRVATYNTPVSRPRIGMITGT